MSVCDGCALHATWLRRCHGGCGLALCYPCRQLHKKECPE